MPCKDAIVCSEGLETTGILVSVTVCETISESVSKSTNTLNVADVEQFKAEIMDLCHRVLRQDNTPEHQALRFRTLVKSIVHESLTTIVLPNNCSKIDN